MATDKRDAPRYLAELLRDQGRLEEAERVLSDGIAAGHDLASNHLIYFLEELGRVDEARHLQRYGLNADGTPAGAPRRPTSVAIPVARLRQMDEPIHRQPRLRSRPRIAASLPSQHRSQWIAGESEQGDMIPIRGSQVGSHHRPTQGDSQSTGVLDIPRLAGIQLQQPTDRTSFASKGSASEFLSTTSLRLKLGSGFTDRRNMLPGLPVCVWPPNFAAHSPDDKT